MSAFHSLTILNLSNFERKDNLFMSLKVRGRTRRIQGVLKMVLGRAGLVFLVFKLTSNHHNIFARFLFSDSKILIKCCSSPFGKDLMWNIKHNLDIKKPTRVLFSFYQHSRWFRNIMASSNELKCQITVYKPK